LSAHITRGQVGRVHPYDDATRAAVHDRFGDRGLTGQEIL